MYTNDSGAQVLVAHESLRAYVDAALTEVEQVDPAVLRVAA